MLRIRSLIFALAVSAPLAAFAFEGTVDYQIQSGDGKTQNMEYQIKGQKFRMNMHTPEHGDAATLFDTPNRTMYILMPEKKMAMKRTMPEVKSTPKATSHGKETFTNTGRKETVAGHECTVYAYKSEDGEGEVCSAQDMGSFYYANSRGGEQPAWQKEAMAKGFFPLKTSNKSAKNGKTFTMVATKIVPGSLPASLFEVPKDYKMMEGFAGGPGAGGPGMAPGADFQKKLMAASPEERAKMIEQMKKQYGQQ